MILKRSRVVLAICWAVLFGVTTTPQAHAHDYGQPGAARVFEAALAAVPSDDPAAPAAHSFIATRLIWGAGKLAVCFWNGDAKLQQRVADVADELVAGRSVAFDWKPAGAFVKCPNTGYDGYVVRVSLREDPSLVASAASATSFFATIGRAALVDKARATVNLPFKDTPGEDLLRSKTLHEFCHVLGCLHEHQAGYCNDEFDKTAIMANIPMTDAEYEQNFLRIPSTNAYMDPMLVGVFDKDSIMLYSFYPWEFKNYKTAKCYRPYEVTKLSKRDEAGLTSVYPLTKAAAPKSLAEFDTIAQAYALSAANFRGLAATTRFNLNALPIDSKNLAPSQIAAMRADVEQRALALDIKAKTAEVTAAQFTLSPEARAKIDAALSLLPPDPPGIG